MDSKELLNFLNKQNLIPIAKSHSRYFRKVLFNCLNIKNENVLIISDYGHLNQGIAPILAAAYYFSAKKIGVKVSVAMQNVKLGSDIAANSVTESLLKLNPNSVIILCLSNKLGKLSKIRKTYRRFVMEKKHRFISCSGLGSLRTSDVYHIINAMNINYDKLSREGQKIKQKLDYGKELRIVTKAGTDLTFNIRGEKSKVIDGNYTKKATGGNLPAGEIYMPPKRDSARGTLVIDGSVRHRNGTEVVKVPVVLEIQKGTITRITGGNAAKLLRKSLQKGKTLAKHPSTAFKIGEIGIGLNPRAEIIGATIVDEKALGTTHIGIGSNSWFGGDIFSAIHLDQVFRDPKIFIDGKELKMPKKRDLL